MKPWVGCSGFFLLLPVLLSGGASALPAGAYQITGLSVDNFPGTMPNGSAWDALDRVPDLMVVFFVGNDSILVTSTITSSAGASWAPMRSCELGQNSVVRMILWDKDLAYNDLMDQIEITAASLQPGENYFSSSLGTVFGLTIESAGVNQQLEPYQLSRDYSANFGGTGSAWTCRVEIAGEYFSSPNTSVEITLLAGRQEMCSWSGIAGSGFLQGGSADIEFGLNDPVYIVPLNDSLLAFYECPENFEGFRGAGIGLRPCQIILAYDPVLLAVVPVLTPQKIEQRLLAEQNEHNRALMHLAGPFILQYLTGLDPTMFSAISEALSGMQ